MKARESKPGEETLDIATVDERGRITLPHVVRRGYSLDSGVRVVFVKSRDGELVLRKL